MSKKEDYINKGRRGGTGKKWKIKEGDGRGVQKSTKGTNSEWKGRGKWGCE